MKEELKKQFEEKFCYINAIGKLNIIPYKANEIWQFISDALDKQRQATIAECVDKLEKFIILGNVEMKHMNLEQVKEQFELSPLTERLQKLGGE